MSKISKLSGLIKLSVVSLMSLFVFAVVFAADSNANLSLQKDKGTGLFILNMRDSQGIKSFSLVFPTDKLPYSGDLNGCPTSRKIDNITINDPSDFKPLMNAVILDCQGNETEFEITASVDGIAQVKKTGIEPTPTPAPTPQQLQQSSQSGGQAPAVQNNANEKRETDALADIKYPVKELGNCENKESCKSYCEKSANIDRCLKFAEENNLLKRDEIERGKKFSEIVNGGGGPNGCKTEKDCFEYCNDVDRIDECVAFAEKNGFMEGKELEEAKKIQSIVKSGKSMPGNCKNRTACEAYCKNIEHMDECISFAKENGMMSEEEIKEAEKFLPLMKSGQTPGGCKSKEECDAFCNADEHFEECFNFADKAGLITDKERDIMKKTGGKGPGGCRGRACQTFCENPANQKTCFKFAKENGLMSEEDLARMEEGKKMLKEQLENGPPEIQECLKSVIDVNELESEGFAGGPELGEKMRKCFEKMIPEGMHEQFEFGEKGEFRGPGGCKSREECETYCRSNPDACGIKMPPREGEHGELPNRPDGDFGSSSKNEAPPGCSFEELNPVCATVSPGKHHTFNNECFAKAYGATGLQPGACPGDVPCPTVRDTVCAVKGGFAQSYFNKCAAEGDDASVLYAGECKPYGQAPPAGASEGFQQQYQQQFQGPGGCQTPEECIKYCTQNYTDPACQKFMPQGSSISIQSPFALLLWPILKLLK